MAQQASTLAEEDEAMGLQKFVNWLFRFEDLTPPGSDARYLYRWTLFSLFGFFKIYLHKIMALSLIHI